MPIPAYLWLKDDGGALIRGSVDVQDRESSIEVIGFSHAITLPVDSQTGKATGNVHMPQYHLRRISIHPAPIYLRL